MMAQPTVYECSPRWGHGPNDLSSITNFAVGEKLSPDLAQKSPPRQGTCFMRVRPIRGRLNRRSLQALGRKGGVCGGKFFPSTM